MSARCLGLMGEGVFDFSVPGEAIHSVNVSPRAKVNYVHVAIPVTHLHKLVLIQDDRFLHLLV